MTTYSWEKKESAGSWVPFEGTPNAQNPTEEFEAGTWDVRVTVSEGAQTAQKTRNAYVTVEDAPSYTGPLDLVPGALCGYSLRALAAAYEEKLVMIEQTGGEFADQDFLPTDNHAIDVAAVNAFILAGGAEGFGYRWWNQVNNAIHQLNGTDTFWLADAGNGLPGFRCNGDATDSFDNGAAPVTFPAGARTYAFVINYTQNDDGGVLLRSSFGGIGLDIGAYWNVENDVYLYANDGGEEEVAWVSTQTLTTGLHLIEIVVQASGATAIRIDGVDAEATVAQGAQFVLPEITGFGMPINGETDVDILEFIAWPIATTGAEAHTMAYYGIS